MRINSITLTNFRQFSGTQTFELQSSSLKPVSLIFGANGAGKTTLLNAFTWALYGTMSEDVEEQHRMVTDSVWRALPAGASAELAVELRFDHEGHDYRLRRSADVRKQSDEQQKPSAEVRLWQTMADGSSEAIGAPQERDLQHSAERSQPVLLLQRRAHREAGAKRRLRRGTAGHKGTS